MADVLLNEKSPLINYINRVHFVELSQEIYGVENQNEVSLEKEKAEDFIFENL